MRLGADDAVPAVPEYHSERLSGTQAFAGEGANALWASAHAERQRAVSRHADHLALTGKVTLCPLIPTSILATIRLDHKPSGIRF
jgi:hypothetical protein